MGDLVHFQAETKKKRYWGIEREREREWGKRGTGWGLGQPQEKRESFKCTSVSVCGDWVAETTPHHRRPALRRARSARNFTTPFTTDASDRSFSHAEPCPAYLSLVLLGFTGLPMFDFIRCWFCLFLQFTGFSWVSLIFDRSLGHWVSLFSSRPFYLAVLYFGVYFGFVFYLVSSNLTVILSLFPVILNSMIRLRFNLNWVRLSRNSYYILKAYWLVL